MINGPNERNEFSVYSYYPNGRYVVELRFVSAEQAVNRVRHLITTFGANLGTIKRITITDGGDSIVFEWIYGQGVTFP